MAAHASGSLKSFSMSRSRWRSARGLQHMNDMQNALAQAHQQHMADIMDALSQPADITLIRDASPSKAASDGCWLGPWSAQHRVRRVRRRGAAHPLAHLERSAAVVELSQMAPWRPTGRLSNGRVFVLMEARFCQRPPFPFPQPFPSSPGWLARRKRRQALTQRSVEGCQP